jgi:hypothetical protein
MVRLFQLWLKPIIKSTLTLKYGNPTCRGLSPIWLSEEVASFVVV